MSKSQTNKRTLRLASSVLATARTPGTALPLNGCRAASGRAGRGLRPRFFTRPSAAFCGYHVAPLRVPRGLRPRGSRPSPALFYAAFGRVSPKKTFFFAKSFLRGSIWIFTRKSQLLIGWAVFNSDFRCGRFRPNGTFYFFCDPVEKKKLGPIFFPTRFRLDLVLKAPHL